MGNTKADGYTHFLLCVLQKQAQPSGSVATGFATTDLRNIAPRQLSAVPVTFLGIAPLKKKYTDLNSSVV